MEEKIIWHDDVLIKQLLSYAVGCMMGRYSIDKPGLILASQGESVKEYNERVPDSRFEVDDDGIIPVMSADCEFPDNVPLRIKTWLSVVLVPLPMSEGHHSPFAILMYVIRICVSRNARLRRKAKGEKTRKPTVVCASTDLHIA